MSLIFYSLCGEGLGHCSRAMALIEHMPQHRFVLFTYGEAFDYFSKTGLPNVSLVLIEGVRFVEKEGKVDLWPTMKGATKFVLTQLKKNVELMTLYGRWLEPELFLTDWEPTAARVARNLNKPCVSIDSQHKFRFSKMTGFSWFLKAYAVGVMLGCKFMVPKAAHYLVSTFQAEIIPGTEKVTPCKGFFRKEFERLQPSDEGHVVVYCRQKEILQKLLPAIGTDRPIFVYGVDHFGDYPNVTFKPKGYEPFVKDVATSHAVFSTAGVQLIGECRFFGKPIFVIPLPNQYEQYVNGRYVDILGLGASCLLENLTAQKVTDFLHKYRDGLKVAENGVHKAVEILEEYLTKEAENEPQEDPVCVPV